IKAFYEPLLRVLGERGIVVAVASAPGADLDDLAAMRGVMVRAVPITRRITPVRDIRAVVALARFLRRRGVRLVHTHTPKGGLVGMLAAWFARVPHRIHTMHGLPLETTHGLRRVALIAAERLTCALADTVCVVSDSLRRRAVALRLAAPDKLRVLGHGTACGVDHHRFEPTAVTARSAAAKRDELRIPQDALVIGFVGRIVYDKGIHTLVDAFTSLVDRYDTLHLLLLGDVEPQHRRLPARTIDTIRRHPRIRHVGFDWNPIPYYAAMDILALPTLREGFGCVLLEAACMELPVVATRTTGCVDAVADGETGILVGPGDGDGLIAALRRLLDNKDLRSALGRAGRTRARTCFGQHRMIQAHLDLYAATAPPLAARCAARGDA
ncbi:MAG: glycosyltransferase family 4 protein, partial [Phycisphaerae bacterium]